MSSRTAFWITDILSDHEARAFAFGEGSSLDFPFAVAAKTGTSQAYHDNWTVGFTRDVTVGVWVGNFDRSPLRGSSGVTGAGPIFHDVMLAAVERAQGALPLFDPAPLMAPASDLHRVTLCALSGLVAGAACPVRVQEYLPASAMPTTCDWHHATERGVVTRWPEAYQEWAGADHAHPVGPAVSTNRVATAGTALMIASPAAQAIFLIDPTLRPDFQTLPLRAGKAVGRVHWFVDDEPVGISLGTAPLAWPLKKGRHIITARDADGREAKTTILVK